MEQLLALLLIAYAVTVRGMSEPRLDPCTNGEAALRLYGEYEGCSGSSPYEYVADFKSAFQNNLTVDNLVHMFSNYCSTMFPKLGPCFQKNIENCNSSQRNTLMTLANQTGFVCQANTNRTHPVVQHLFSRLTNADLAVNGQCSGEEHAQTPMICYNRSLEAAGLAVANASEIVLTLSVVDLVTKYQTYFKTSMNCTVTRIHDNHEQCSAWRGKALSLTIFQFLPTMMGNVMPFTTADIDIMFGWPIQILG